MALAMLSGAVFAADAAAPAAAAPVSKNMLYDGSFDTVKAMSTGRHWGLYKNGVYYGWIGDSNLKPADGKCELDNTVFSSKPASLKMTNQGNGKAVTIGQNLHYCKLKLQPGKKYRLSFMIKLQDVEKPGVCLLVWNNKNIWFPYMKGTSDWQKVEYIHTAEKDSDKSPRLQYTFRLGGKGTVWVDDAVFEEVAE